MEFGTLFAGVTWQTVLLCAVACSIGWGIRGNFGHEYGAAMPGALVAMAAVLSSGRPDWWQHVHYFAMFGALGWAFGGSMSYMMVVGFTHSGHPPSSLYGFACLFVLGFLWAALGGAGTVLPAFIQGSDLGLFFLPIGAVVLGWGLQSVVIDWLFRASLRGRSIDALSWYDTDWLAAAVAVAATLVVAAARGGLDIATSMILHLAIGWIVSFLVLVNVLKLRMNPPRGDNWAGCVGMVAGLLVFCWRCDLHGVTFVTLLTGLLGGLGFGLGQLLKLLNLRTGLETNWHSVMEQIHGAFHGIALAVAMGLVAQTAPIIADSPGPPAGILAVAVVLVGITYLNHRKCERRWSSCVSALGGRLYGLQITGRFWASRGVIGWSEVLYAAIGGAIIWLMVRHVEQPLSVMPESWLGQGQLLMLVFLWWVVTMNFSQEIVGFTARRIVTEGLITFNAVVCTVLLLALPQTTGVSTSLSASVPYLDLCAQAALLALIAVPLAVFAEWGISLAVWGRRLIPFKFVHIRFGANATTEREIPQSEYQSQRTTGGNR